MRRRSARTNSSCHPHARRPGRSAPVESSDLRQPAGDTRPPSRSRPCHGRVGVRCRARAGMAQVTEHAQKTTTSNCSSGRAAVRRSDVEHGLTVRASGDVRDVEWEFDVAHAWRIRTVAQLEALMPHEAGTGGQRRRRIPPGGLSGATPTPRAGIERCRERPAVRLPSQCTGGARGPTDVDRPA